MATGDDHGRVRLWRLPMGRATGRVFTHAPQLEDVSLSPDGRRLALTGEPWGVDIVDVGTGRTVRAGLGRGAIAGFGRFDRTGRFLVTAGWKGWTRLWSTRDWRPLTRELTGHAGPITWASLSRDDRTLATGATDGGVRLWDVQAQQPLGPPLPGLANHYVMPELSPDGTSLFALYDTGRLVRWDVRPADWERRACAIAGRRLTRTEWAQALPQRNYNPTC
jgi:WD40 repeat protein